MHKKTLIIKNASKQTKGIRGQLFESFTGLPGIHIGK